MRLLLLICLAMAFATNCACALTNISALNYQDASGKDCVLSAAGRLTMLAVIKPTCSDCMSELPNLADIAKQYSGKLQLEVIVYGVDYTAIPDFKKKFDGLANVTYFADPTKTSRTLFSIRYVPYLAFFSAQGAYLGCLDGMDGVIPPTVITSRINTLLES